MAGRLFCEQLGDENKATTTSSAYTPADQEQTQVSQPSNTEDVSMTEPHQQPCIVEPNSPCENSKEDVPNNVVFANSGSAQEKKKKPSPPSLDEKWHPSKKMDPPGPADNQSVKLEGEHENKLCDDTSGERSCSNCEGTKEEEEHCSEDKPPPSFMNRWLIAYTKQGVAFLMEYQKNINDEKTHNVHGNILAMLVLSSLAEAISLLRCPPFMFNCRDSTTNLLLYKQWYLKGQFLCYGGCEIHFRVHTPTEAYTMEGLLCLKALLFIELKSSSSLRCQMVLGTSCMVMQCRLQLGAMLIQCCQPENNQKHLPDLGSNPMHPFMDRQVPLHGECCTHIAEERVKLLNQHTHNTAKKRHITTLSSKFWSRKITSNTRNRKQIIAGTRSSLHTRYFFIAFVYQYLQHTVWALYKQFKLLFRFPATCQQSELGNNICLDGAVSLLNTTVFTVLIKCNSNFFSYFFFRMIPTVKMTTMMAVTTMAVTAPAMIIAAVTTAMTMTMTAMITITATMTAPTTIMTAMATTMTAMAMTMTALTTTMIAMATTALTTTMTAMATTMTVMATTMTAMATTMTAMATTMTVMATTMTAMAMKITAMTTIMMAMKMKMTMTAMIMITATMTAPTTIMTAMATTMTAMGMTMTAPTTTMTAMTTTMTVMAMTMTAMATTMTAMATTITAMAMTITAMTTIMMAMKMKMTTLMMVLIIHYKLRVMTLIQASPILHMLSHHHPYPCHRVFQLSDLKELAL